MNNDQHAELAAACESVGLIHQQPGEGPVNWSILDWQSRTEENQLSTPELLEKLEGWLRSKGYRTILRLSEELCQVSWRLDDWKTVIALASKPDEQIARVKCAIATVKKLEGQE